MTKKKITTKKSVKPGILSGLKGGTSMAIAGGAVAGAAIGAAAAVALSNTKTRKAIGTGVKQVSLSAADMLETADKAGYATHHKATKQLHKITKPVKRTASFAE